MHKSIRVMLTIAFTTALFAAFAITVSAKNWYAAEIANGVDRLYITAADTAPADGRSWSADVPTPYNGAGMNAWIIPSSAVNPVEIIIDGDVVCPSGDTLDFGIYTLSSHDITITGADADSLLSIFLTGTRTSAYNGAIWLWGSNKLTISDLCLSLSSASSRYNSSGIWVNLGSIELNNVVIESIVSGNAEAWSFGINIDNGSISITDSKIKSIITGNSENSIGIETWKYYSENRLIITDSIINMKLTAPGAVGISTNHLIIGEANPNAKYPLDIDIAAAGRAYSDINTFDAGTVAALDADAVIKTAGATAPGTEYSTADFFTHINGTYSITPAKYARIYVMEQVATPVITEATVNQQSKKRVTIACATPDAKIYYRLDGGDISKPADGMLYTGPFEIGEDASITARGFKKGYARSELATRDVESSYDFNVALMQYMFLVANQPTYRVSVVDGVTAAVKAGLNLNALRAGELVTLTVEADEDGEYTAPTVTTTGGGKVYLTDMGGGVYTFKMPGRSVIVKP